MKFTEKYSRLFQLLLPSPLSIVLLLSLVTIAAAYIFNNYSNSVNQNYLINLYRNPEMLFLLLELLSGKQNVIINFQILNTAQNSKKRVPPEVELKTDFVFANCTKK